MFGLPTISKLFAPSGKLCGASETGTAVSFLRATYYAVAFVAIVTMLVLSSDGNLF